MYFFIPPLGPFFPQNAALPLNSLFWSPLTAVHRFDASDMAVPGLYFLLKIFLENHFSQNYCVTLLKNMYRSQIKSWCKLQRCNYLFSVLGGGDLFKRWKVVSKENRIYTLFSSKFPSNIYSILFGCKCLLQLGFESYLIHFLRFRGLGFKSTVFPSFLKQEMPKPIVYESHKWK